MKAGSDWCLFLPLGESPLSWAQLMTLWMGTMLVVNMMVTYVNGT